LINVSAYIEKHHSNKHMSNVRISELTQESIRHCLNSIHCAWWLSVLNTRI